MKKNNLQNLSKDELLKLLLQSQSELTENKGGIGKYQE